MNLDWVTTEDHHEDWFVIATSSEEACKFHEDNEGYDPGDAKAEKVLGIPKDIFTETDWPPEELLTKPGAKFIQKDNIGTEEIVGIIREGRER